VDGILVPRNSWLVPFDVNSLFPNVETAEAIDICAKEVGGGKGEMVRDTLNVVMRNDYFNCIGEVWKMREFGTAQGTPCSPPHANLYLAHLERELKETSPHVWPYSWKDALMVALPYSIHRQWHNSGQCNMIH
jgi:hypothetical protein